MTLDAEVIIVAIVGTVSVLGLGYYALRGARQQPPPADHLAWPRHLFVHLQEVGLGYGGLVYSRDEASDTAQMIVGHHVMKTGKMAISNYWTTTRETFTKSELEAFEKAPKELRED